MQINVTFKEAKEILNEQLADYERVTDVRIIRIVQEIFRDDDLVSKFLLSPEGAGLTIKQLRAALRKIEWEKLRYQRSKQCTAIQQTLSNH